MLYIFDKNDNLIDILSNEALEDPIISNDKYKRQVNGEWSYTFDINITKLVQQNIKVKNKVGFYDENNNFQLFTIEEIEDTYSEEDIKQVYALHEFYTLANKTIEDKRVENGTALQGCTKALEGTGWTVGNIAELGNGYTNFYYISSLEALNEVVKTFGGELNFRLELNANKTKVATKYVDLLYRHGQDTGLKFDFDTNLLEVKRKVDAKGLYTVLYGRGSAIESGEGYSRKITFEDVNNGLKYIEDLEGINLWGRIEGVFEYETEDTTDLFNATSKKLQEVNKPFISYSANIVDLAKITGYEHFKVTLGDTIFIYDNDLDLNLEARILEENYSIFDQVEKDIVLANFLKGISQNTEIQTLKNKIDKIEEKGVAVNYPDTLPTVPTLTANGLFSTVQLSWTYEGKVHYEYEVYASKVLNFTPDSSNLIYRGKASAYLHEVLPKETWYYRVRAINTHGNYTDYSTQVTATTLKITDATQYFEDVAISHALIKDLDMDKATVGHLKGTRIDMKEVTVTDGNNNTTFEVDSFGNVNIKANNIKMLVDNVEEGIATSSEVTQSANAIDYKFTNSGGNNLVRNSGFLGHDESWVFSEWQNFGAVGKQYWYDSSEYVLSGKTTLVLYSITNDTISLGGGVSQFIKVQKGKTYTMSMLWCGHRSEGVTEIYNITPNGDRNGLLSLSDFKADVYLPNGNLPDGGKDINHWKRSTATFIPTEDTIQIYIWLSKSQSFNPHLWVTDVKIEEGTVATAWKPNANEVQGYYTRISQDGVKVYHDDGSYTGMGAEGIMRYQSSGNKFYHYLSTLGEVFVNSEQTVEISLPEDYRNKNITVIASASQIGTGTDATTNTKPVISFYVDVVDVYNNPSGRSPYFRLYCSTRLRNTDGSVAYQDKGVLASWTAIS